MIWQICAWALLPLTGFWLVVAVASKAKPADISTFFYAIAIIVTASDLVLLGLLEIIGLVHGGCR